MEETITIEIPVTYLLILGAHGNMGSGDIPDTMKLWAQRKLIECGYQKQLREAQDERLNALRKNLRNIIGNEEMNKIDNAIDNAKTGLDFAMQLNKTRVQ